MNLKTLLVTFSIAFLCASCGDKMCEKNLRFLEEIEGDYMNKSAVANCGAFEKVDGIDVDMYAWHNGDTTLMLTYSGEGNEELYSIEYRIPFSKINSTQMRRFFTNQGLVFRTAFSLTKMFCLYQPARKQLYLGVIKDNTLVISRPSPRAVKRINGV